MATTAQRIIDLAQAVGADIKLLKSNGGLLSALNTTAKGNIVAALNEVLAIAQAAGGGGVVINDAATNGATTVVWSADKVFDEIAAMRVSLKSELVNGAGAALDTFAELATALGNDPTFAATIATGLGNRVRFDAAQVLTAAQKTQACANIGIGEPDTDFVALYTAAKV